MPTNIIEAINFLETQWSSINENKTKGILAEIGLKDFLNAEGQHVVPGGWIFTPGNNQKVDIPFKEKICIIPRKFDFTWESSVLNVKSITPAEISAYNYFNQLGIPAYFAELDINNQSQFQLPQKKNGKKPANFPRSYQVNLIRLGPNGGMISQNVIDVFRNFPQRINNRGLRVSEVNRIDQNFHPWNNAGVVSDLFCFEYMRYYFQVNYMISNNDLDLFMIGASGAPYPVEIKSKSPGVDKVIGEWFGIDMGPFAKMAFFTTNTMNTDALYIVEEVDDQRAHINWLAIKFTDLVKSCSWVGQAGGKGMMGGNSATYKIPKVAFSNLIDLIPKL
jgi:hypothetical protein